MVGASGGVVLTEVSGYADPGGELDPSQFDLIEALQRRPGKFNFAHMYVGSLYVLRQVDNPLRHVLSAHGLRELMEKLPGSYENVPSASVSLKEQVCHLRDAWVCALGKTQCKTDDGWRGDVDKPLRNFLEQLRDWFDRFSDDNPTHKVRADQFLQSAEFRRVPLPDTIRSSQVNQWRDCYDYFVGVAHHRRPVDDEFTKWLSFLERFLLDRLAPRTHLDRRDLDDLIARGEGR